MKYLTVTDEETLLELAVEHAADSVAEEIGLKQGKSSVGTTFYISPRK